MRTLSNSFFALLFASLLMVGCGGESAESAEDMSADSSVVVTEVADVASDSTAAPAEGEEAAADDSQPE